MPTIRSRRLLRYLQPILTALGVLIGILCVAGSDRAMSGIQKALAVLSSALLNGLGQHTTVIGTTVQSDIFGISVVTACTGVFITGLFLVAVAAFPARWTGKLVGAGIGIVGIFSVNVIRLVSLYFIGVHWPNILDPAHQLIWQSLLILIAVALWLLWAGRWAHAASRS